MTTRGQRKLIRYAGFDPDENDFSDIVLLPDNRYDFGRNMAKLRVSVDPAIIRIMRAASIPYRIIGELAAEVYNRPVRFKTETMSQIICHSRKGKIDHARTK